MDQTANATFIGMVDADCAAPKSKVARA